MNDYAPESTPLVQLSPIVRETNRKIAMNALRNLNDGELLELLEGYMLDRFQARRGAAIMADIARRMENKPWLSEVRK